MNIMGELEGALSKLRAAEAIKTAVGAAISNEQKIALYEKVKGGPSNFITWSQTEPGKKAISDLVDAFTKGEESKSRPSDTLNIKPE